MLTRFSDDLAKQELYANGAELAQKLGLDRDAAGNRVYTWPDSRIMHLHTLDNPVLMRDHYRVTQLEDTVLRDTLLALYESPQKIVEYDGVSLKFDEDKYPGVWSPSIDTMLFLKALRSAELGSPKSAVEVGAGSGYIAKYLLEKQPSLEEMTLIDINPNAEACWRDNISSPKARFVIGEAQKGLAGQYDLIVCNPPYVPRPKSIDDNAYEGLGLAAHLIANADNLLTQRGKLIINLSNLSMSTLSPLINQAGLDAKVLEEMEVPLKVFNILNNKEWMAYLLADGLRKQRHDGYDYWQTITVHEFMRQPK
jgi:release factor glutamine methyltransferase